MSQDLYSKLKLILWNINPTSNVVEIAQFFHNQFLEINKILDSITLPQLNSLKFMVKPTSSILWSFNALIALFAGFQDFIDNQILDINDLTWQTTSQYLEQPIRLLEVLQNYSQLIFDGLPNKNQEISKKWLNRYKFIAEEEQQLVKISIFRMDKSIQGRVILLVDTILECAQLWNENKPVDTSEFSFDNEDKLIEQHQKRNYEERIAEQQQLISKAQEFRQKSKGKYEQKQKKQSKKRKENTFNSEKKDNQDNQDSKLSIEYYSNKKQELKGRLQNKLKEIGKIEQVENVIKWQAEKECKQKLKDQEKEKEEREMSNKIQQCQLDDEYKMNLKRMEKINEMDNRRFKMELMMKKNRSKEEGNKSYEKYLKEYSSKYLDDVDDELEKEMELKKMQCELKQYEKKKNQEEMKIQRLLCYQSPVNTQIRN